VIDLDAIQVTRLFEGDKKLIFTSKRLQAFFHLFKAALRGKMVECAFSIDRCRRLGVVVGVIG